jgi:malate dehydrogenase (oxaloacetate-decarboxylating)
MARHVKRPVILPISNPTDLTEAYPADVLEWTAGKALVATGSPFPPVAYRGREVVIGQCNNVFIFPGLGMGALLAETATISSGMVRSAAYSVAQNVSEAELAAGMLFPEVSRLREISRKVARAVMRVASEEGIGKPMTEDERSQALDDFIWEPVYQEYTAA